MIIMKASLVCLEVQQVMGKTVPSCRIALEGEISRWSGFAKALRREDREAFDELMDACRSFASESSNATNPIIFEPLVISMLLSQHMRISRIEKKLSVIKQPSSPVEVEQKR